MNGFQRDTEPEQKYWAEVLAAISDTTPLLSRINAQPDAATTEMPFGSLKLNCLADEKSAFKAIAKRYRVTVNIIVQAAWAVLLSRYTAEQDVIFGETRACRRFGPEGIASVVGILINTVPICLQIHAERTFAQLLQDLRREHVEVRPFEHTPLSRIREWSHISSEAQLFDTVIVFEDQELAYALQQEGCELWSNGVQRFGYTHYPLTLRGYSQPELQIELTYQNALIGNTFARQIAGHLRNLLASAVINPDTRIHELSLLTDSEYEQLITRFNRKFTKVPTAEIRA